MANEAKLLTETMAKLKAVHAEDLQRREDLALKSGRAGVRSPLGGDRVAGLGGSPDGRGFRGRGGLLHPPPLPRGGGLVALFLRPRRCQHGVPADVSRALSAARAFAGRSQCPL